jgi:hypothetical protein
LPGGEALYRQPSEGELFVPSAGRRVCGRRRVRVSLEHPRHLRRRCERLPGGHVDDDVSGKQALHGNRSERVVHLSASAARLHWPRKRLPAWQCARDVCARRERLPRGHDVDVSDPAHVHGYLSELLVLLSGGPRGLHGNVGDEIL